MRIALKHALLLIAGILAIAGTLSAAMAQTTPQLTAEELGLLFSDLKAAKTGSEARVAELKIWEAWIKSGDDEIDKLTNLAVLAMQAQKYQDALAVLDVIVAKKPDFAEGWNKRATVLYIIGDLDRSMADIEKVLVLEPRHFGAFSGIGLIQVAKGNKQAALEAYRRVIEIYPLSQGAIVSIENLEKEVEGDPT
jgi:tetratricopeptide (TPR) repeat protein